MPKAEAINLRFATKSTAHIGSGKKLLKCTAFICYMLPCNLITSDMHQYGKENPLSRRTYPINAFFSV